MVLMSFAFRIGNHFGFSGDANFGALIDERYPFRVIRSLYNVLMATRPSAVFPHHRRGLEANAPAEAPEFPSERRGSSPTSGPSRRHTRLSGARARPRRRTHRRAPSAWSDLRRA